MNAPNIAPIYTAEVYTEALAEARASVAGAEAIDSGDGPFTPTGVVVHYEWRTQLGHVGWRVGNIDLAGTRPTAEGAPSSATLIVRMDSAPDWLVEFAQAHMPSCMLAIGTPGTPEQGNVEPVRRYEGGETCGGVRLTGFSSHYVLRHVVARVEVEEAPIEMLDGYGVEQGQYVRPENLAVEYTWGTYPDTSLWQVREVSVTGPKTTAEGEPAGGGSLRVAPPVWAHEFATANLPTHIRLVEGESPSDTALRHFDEAAGDYHRAAERRASAEEHEEPQSVCIELCHAEDDAAARASTAAEHLIDLLNAGGEIPARWADNPRPETVGETRKWTLLVESRHPMDWMLLRAAAEQLCMSLGEGATVAIHDAEGDEVAWMQYDHYRDVAETGRRIAEAQARLRGTD